MPMKLLTKEVLTKLLKNGQMTLDGKEVDHKPVAKFFGGGACTWLITELDPRDNDTMFGLCDIGHGTPELGYVSFKELQSLRFPPFRLPIERDLYFTPDKTLTEYADAARIAGRIIA